MDGAGPGLEADHPRVMMWREKAMVGGGQGRRSECYPQLSGNGLTVDKYPTQKGGMVGVEENVFLSTIRANAER